MQLWIELIECLLVSFWHLASPHVKCVHGLLFMNVFSLMKAYMLKCVTVLDFMLELHFERGGTDEKIKLCNAKKEKKKKHPLTTN